MKKRIVDFAARIPRFKKLRRAGVNTARLLRTGMRAMTYGESIGGVSNSTLYTQRKIAAVIAAPVSGTCGQNIDMALMLADESNTGRADPAYDAHMLPIGEWALAVWEGWRKLDSIMGMVKRACSRLTGAKNPCKLAYGPAAAFVLTCWRLGWTVVSGVVVITDTGRELNLTLDPPAVILKQCRMAVQRWRWKRIEKSFPQLAANGSGRGALMEPIWQLLRDTKDTPEWNGNHRGALKSQMAGRQWTQTRVHKAGWSEHNRCLTCLSTIVDAETPPPDQCVRTERDEVGATADQIARAPVGNSAHRLWTGRCNHALRT